MNEKFDRNERKKKMRKPRVIVDEEEAKTETERPPINGHKKPHSTNFHKGLIARAV
jgi:hypothetical protein